MRRLADPLPLRTTAEWPGFRDAVPLPVRIGRTRGTLLQYDQARTKWVWGGHACEGIDAVFVGGLPATDWQAGNVLDAAGKPVAMVTFSTPQPEGAQLSAQGRGLQDATTGILIENPADALAAILIDIGGLALSRASLATFRSEAAANGLIVGGSIEAADSAQSIARALTASVGARFGSAARDLAFLWPALTSGTARFTVRDDGPNVTRAVALSDFCNDLTIQYDFDGTNPRGSLRLVAPAQIARYGSFPQTLAATWLTSAGVAQRVGARLLAHSARKVWSITAEGLRTSDLRIGYAVAFEHALMTSDPITVLSRRRTTLDTCTITARAPIGAAPSVAIASQSAYLDPNAYVSAELDIVGQNRIFTIRDSDGTTPLPGAGVRILPSGPTHVTDASGRVSFTALQMPAGHHFDLGCTTADGRYFTFSVDV